MMVLILGSGAFFALALILRELQLARERALAHAAQQQLQVALEGTRAQLRRVAEDLYVLHTVLVERHVLSDTDLARSRARLIDAPRRRSEERDAIAQHLGAAAPHLVVDDGDNKVH